MKQKVQSKYNLVQDDVAVAFRALGLKEIPPEFRHMKMIARGNTSIILEKDPETVVMLTRDSMKKDWLHFGLGISQNWSIHDIHFGRKKYSDFPVFAITMPKLYKLSSSNKSLVHKEISFWKKAMDEVYHKQNTGLLVTEHVSEFMRFYEAQGKEDSLIYKVLDWLQNYGSDQYQFDLAVRQFAQDKDGNIVLVDPIVARDLVKVMFSA